MDKHEIRKQERMRAVRIIRETCCESWPFQNLVEIPRILVDERINEAIKRIYADDQE